MQIVIDIDENVYTRLFDNGGDDESDIAKVCTAVRGGTPLPEHHGRLIDTDNIALIDEEFYVPSDYYVAKSAINDAPTIIEGSDSECQG